jgi:hypothetical protein
MLIGILSDTHDQLPQIDAAVAYFRKKGVEHLIHAGDFIAPFSVKRLKAVGCPVTAVYGNNDGERFGIRKAFGDWGEVHERVVKLELGGRRIVVVHEGDLVEELAASGLHDVVIYGHSHGGEIRGVGETLIINPGPGGGVPDGGAQCVLLDLAKMDAKVKGLG